MDEVLKFLKDNPVFYFATVDGDEPKVRPFGFIMEFENKLYFTTSNQKDVYKQLQNNPKFEVCTNSATNEWIRLKGKVVMDSRKEVREKAFEVGPFFKDLYGTPDNETFTCFYILDGEATISSMAGNSKTYKL